MNNTLKPGHTIAPVPVKSPVWYKQQNDRNLYYEQNKNNMNGCAFRAMRYDIVNPIHPIHAGPFSIRGRLKVSANERGRYMCKVFSQWRRPHPATDTKQSVMLPRRPMHNICATICLYNELTLIFWITFISTVSLGRIDSVSILFGQ